MLGKDSQISALEQKISNLTKSNEILGQKAQNFENLTQKAQNSADSSKKEVLSLQKALEAQILENEKSQNEI